MEGDLKEGLNRFVLYGKHERFKNCVTITKLNLFSLAMNFATYGNLRFEKFLPVVMLAMMRSGKHIPSPFFIHGTMGRGMVFQKANAVWKVLMNPQETTIKDIGDIFFEDVKFDRYFKKEGMFPLDVNEAVKKMMREGKASPFNWGEGKEDESADLMYDEVGSEVRDEDNSTCGTHGVHGSGLCYTAQDTVLETPGTSMFAPSNTLPQDLQSMLMVRRKWKRGSRRVDAYMGCGLGHKGGIVGCTCHSSSTRLLASAWV